MTPSDKKALLFLLGHAVRGAAGGVTAGLGLLVLDVGNLRTLALHDADGALALALLFFALAASFAAAAVGGAFSDPSCDLEGSESLIRPGERHDHTEPERGHR